MNSPAEFEKQIAEVRTVPASSFGTSMVVAPHPDDETLGCGGTVALLFKNNFQVHFIFVSDGTMSHPHSKKFPAPRLRELREKEAINAVEILGGKAENTAFLALPDRRVPTTDNPYFESIVRHLVTRIELLKPESIFIPWQNDPHPDHRATWQLLTEAVARSENKPRLIEYPIWLWEMGDESDIELIQKMQITGVDIHETLGIKRKALSAHRSQISNLIDDDPEGFTLSKEVLAHFNRKREIFFESRL